VNPESPVGLHRVLEPLDADGAPTSLPQAATRLDADARIWPGEVRIDFETLNLDAASYRQLHDKHGGDGSAIRAEVLDIVAERGKMQNPVTKSGGMLIGTVAEVGAESTLGLRVGDKVATLVSLSLTPLQITDGLADWDGLGERVPARGHAILFSRSIAARLPDDLEPELALMVMDVCGAPALVARVVGEFVSSRGLAPTVCVLGGAGKSGSLALAGVADAISAGSGSKWLLLGGMLLTSVGVLFKIGAVPFHAWTPDAYMGAPTPVTGFMAVATKTAAVAALMRVFYVALGGLAWDWQLLFSVVAVITMLVGATAALAQTDIKRLLAYSSIAHAGFILVGVVGAVQAGENVSISSVAAVAFYLLTYGVATLGAFAIVMMVRRAGGEANGLDAWRGLGKRNPVIAVLMTLFMLSFAGIPLTAGFIGKLAVFASAWEGGYGWLVLVAVVMSVIAAFFYLKVVVAMWFQDEDDETVGTVETPSIWTWIVLAVAALATLVLGIVPGAVLDLFASAAQFIR